MWLQDPILISLASAIVMLKCVYQLRGWLCWRLYYVLIEKGTPATPFEAQNLPLLALQPKVKQHSTVQQHASTEFNTCYLI